MTTLQTPPAHGRTSRVALLCFTAALSCASLHAADAPAGATTAPASSAESDDEIVTLSTFTVSSDSADRYRAADAISSVRVRSALIDTPSSISVLTRDVIDDLAPNRIFDVTQYIAGIQDGRGLQFQDRMIIRGFESNGQRTVDNFIQPSDADNIDESIIDRIEVTKGPNAILSPAGAPGGSINVILKSPLYQPRRTLTGQIGLFDAQKLTLDLGGPLGRSGEFAYRLVGSYQDSRRYWSNDSRIRGRVLAPMFGWRISDRTELTVKVVGAEHWIYREPLLILDPSVTADTKKPFLAPGIRPKSRNGVQRWSHVGTHSGDIFTQLTTAVSETISLRFAANGRYYFEDSEQNFLSTPNLNNRYNPMTGELTQDFVWSRATPADPFVATFSPFFDPTNIPNRADKQATRRKTGTFQFDAVSNNKFGEISSQTVAGLAYSRQTAYGRGRNGAMPGINLTIPDRFVVPTYPANYAFYNRNAFTNTQAYINERLSFAQDRVQLTGGILRYDTKTVGRNVLTGAAPSILDDAKNVWMASVLVKPRDNLALYYSHSTNSSPVIANNQPLWRDGVQDEVGFKTEFFDRKLSFNGAWFEIEQTNVTIPNPARQTDPTAPEQLVSDFGNDGFELELMGRLSDNLSAIATYSHLNMRDSLGREVRGVAKNNVSMLLNYRFTDGQFDGLALNLGVVYSGRRAGDIPINFTPLNVVGQVSFFLEPHYSTTFGASYRWQEKYHFRLNIDNILNEKDHIYIAGGRVAGTGITTAPGTNIRLSTTVEF